MALDISRLEALANEPVGIPTTAPSGISIMQSPTDTYQPLPDIPVGIPSEGGLLDEASKGWERGKIGLQSMGQGVKAIAGKAIGSESTVSEAASEIKALQKEGKQYKAAVESYSDVTSPYKALQYLVGGVSENALNMVVSMLGGGLTGAAARILAGGAIKRAATDALAKSIASKAIERGAVTGAYASSLGMEAGSIAEQQLTETGNIDPVRATLGGAFAAVLDVVPEWYLVKKLGLFGGAKGFTGGLLKRAGKGSATQALMEGPTESMQTIIENMSVPGKDMSNKDVWDDVINSGIVGAALGALSGGLLVPKGAQATTPAPQPTPEQAVPPQPQPNQVLNAQGRLVPEGAPSTFSLDANGRVKLDQLGAAIAPDVATEISTLTQFGIQIRQGNDFLNKDGKIPSDVYKVIKDTYQRVARLTEIPQMDEGTTKLYQDGLKTVGSWLKSNKKNIVGPSLLEDETAAKQQEAAKITSEIEKAKSEGKDTTALETKLAEFTPAPKESSLLSPEANAKLEGLIAALPAGGRQVQTAEELAKAASQEETVRETFAPKQEEAKPQSITVPLAEFQKLVPGMQANEVIRNVNGKAEHFKVIEYDTEEKDKKSVVKSVKLVPVPEPTFPSEGMVKVKKKKVSGVAEIIADSNKMIKTGNDIEKAFPTIRYIERSTEELPGPETPEPASLSRRTKLAKRFKEGKIELPGRSVKARAIRAAVEKAKKAGLITTPKQEKFVEDKRVKTEIISKEVIEKGRVPAPVSEEAAVPKLTVEYISKKNPQTPDDLVNIISQAKSEGIDVSGIVGDLNRPGKTRSERVLALLETVAAKHDKEVKALQKRHSEKFEKVEKPAPKLSDVEEALNYSKTKGKRDYYVLEHENDMGVMEPTVYDTVAEADKKAMELNAKYSVRGTIQKQQIPRYRASEITIDGKKKYVIESLQINWETEKVKSTEERRQANPVLYKAYKVFDTKVQDNPRNALDFIKDVLFPWVGAQLEKPRFKNYKVEPLPEIDAMYAGKPPRLSRAENVYKNLGSLYERLEYVIKRNTTKDSNGNIVPKPSSQINLDDDNGVSVLSLSELEGPNGILETLVASEDGWAALNEFDNTHKSHLSKKELSDIDKELERIRAEQEKKQAPPRQDMFEKQRAKFLKEQEKAKKLEAEKRAENAKIEREIKEARESKKLNNLISDAFNSDLIQEAGPPVTERVARMMTTEASKWISEMHQEVQDAIETSTNPEHLDILFDERAIFDVNNNLATMTKEDIPKLIKIHDIFINRNLSDIEARVGGLENVDSVTAQIMDHLALESEATGKKAKISTRKSEKGKLKTTTLKTGLEQLIAEQEADLKEFNPRAKKVSKSEEAAAKAALAKAADQAEIIDKVYPDTSILYQDDDEANIEFSMYSNDGMDMALSALEPIGHYVADTRPSNTFSEFKLALKEFLGSLWNKFKQYASYLWNRVLLARNGIPANTDPMNMVIDGEPRKIPRAIANDPKALLVELKKRAKSRASVLEMAYERTGDAGTKAMADNFRLLSGFNVTNDSNNRKMFNNVFDTMVPVIWPSIPAKTLAKVKAEAIKQSIGKLGFVDENIVQLTGTMQPDGKIISAFSTKERKEAKKSNLAPWMLSPPNDVLYSKAQKYINEAFRVMPKNIRNTIKLSDNWFLVNDNKGTRYVARKITPGFKAIFNADISQLTGIPFNLDVAIDNPHAYSGAIEVEAMAHQFNANEKVKAIPIRIIKVAGREYTIGMMNGEWYFRFPNVAEMFTPGNVEILKAIDKADIEGLKAASTEPMNMWALHGSPNRNNRGIIRKFSKDQWNTGAGDMWQGPGFYFTVENSETVPEYYATINIKQNEDLDTKEELTDWAELLADVEWINKHGGNAQATDIGLLVDGKEIDQISAEEYDKFKIGYYASDLVFHYSNEYKDFKKKFVTDYINKNYKPKQNTITNDIPHGFIYEVDIKDDLKYIDFDKQFIFQKELIDIAKGFEAEWHKKRKAIYKHLSDYFYNSEKNNERIKWGEVLDTNNLRNLAFKIDGYINIKELSLVWNKILQSLGYGGVKYTSSYGNKNIVVFNEDNITIKDVMNLGGKLANTPYANMQIGLFGFQRYIYSLPEATRKLAVMHYNAAKDYAKEHNIDFKDKTATEKMRQAYGWYLDPEGRMKFEISDSRLEIYVSNQNNGKLPTIANIDHIAKLYPEANNIDVIYVDEDDKTFLRPKERGKYITGLHGRPPKIILRRGMPGGQTLTTLAHEIQHFVQDQEGARFFDITDDLIISHGNELIDMYNDDIAGYSLDPHQWEYEIGKAEQKKAIVKKILRDPTFEIKQRTKDILKKDLYMMLVTEVEARLTANRIKFTSKELRDIPFDWDVPLRDTLTIEKTSDPSITKRYLEKRLPAAEIKQIDRDGNEFTVIFPSGWGFKLKNSKLVNTINSDGSVKTIFGNWRLEDAFGIMRIADLHSLIKTKKVTDRTDVRLEHEIFHMVTDIFMTKGEQKMLLDRFRVGEETDKQTWERVAQEYENFAADRGPYAVMSADEDIKIKRDLLTKIQDGLKQLIYWLKDLIFDIDTKRYKTPNALFEAIRNGKITHRKPRLNVVSKEGKFYLQRLRHESVPLIMEKDGVKSVEDPARIAKQRVINEYSGDNDGMFMALASYVNTPNIESDLPLSRTKFEAFRDNYFKNTDANFRQHLEQPMGWFEKFLSNPWFKGSVTMIDKYPGSPTYGQRILRYQKWHGAKRIEIDRFHQNSENGIEYIRATETFHRLKIPQAQALDPIFEWGTTVGNRYLTKEELSSPKFIEQVYKEVGSRLTNYTLNEAQIKGYLEVTSYMKDVLFKKLVTHTEEALLKPYINALSTKEFAELQRLYKILLKGNVPTNLEKLLNRKEFNTKDPLTGRTVNHLSRAYKNLSAKLIEIRAQRARMNELDGYVPLRREPSSHYVSVKAINADGTTTLLENYSAFGAAHGERIKAALFEKIPEFADTEKYDVVIGQSTKPTDSTFFMVGDVNTTRVIDLAINKLKGGDKISMERADDLSDAMYTAVADIMKARGAGMSAIHRKLITFNKEKHNIKGYIKQDFRKIIDGYVYGYYGMQSKFDAANKYMELLRESKQAVGSTDPHVKISPDMYEQISEYAKNNLRNMDNWDRRIGKIKGFMFYYYLAGKLSMMILNTTQNFVTAIPLMATRMHVMKLPGNPEAIMMGAMRDVIVESRLTEDEKKMLDYFEKRGDTMAQYVRNIQIETLGTGSRLASKLLENLARPMKASEEFNRKAAVLAYYRMLTQKAKRTARTAKEIDALYKDCEDFMYNSHWWYSRANAPVSAHGSTEFARISNLLYTFRPFTHNYVLSLAYSFLNYGGTGGLIYAARSFAWLIAIGGIPALPWIDDFVELVEKWYGVPIRIQARQAVEKTAGKAASRFTGAGLAGLLDIDMAAALRPAGIPFVGETSQSAFGVYAGAANKFSKFISELGIGEYKRAFESISPTAAENLFKAYRLYEQGATTSAKNPVYTKEGEVLKISPASTAFQAMGFKNLEYSNVLQDEWEKRVVLKHYADERAKIIKQQHLATTDADRERVQLKMDLYNASIPPYLNGIVKWLNWTPLERPNRTSRLWNQAFNE